MKKLTLFACILFIAFHAPAQDKQPSLKELLNHVVGGTWVSTNKENEGKPEDYKTFYMNFKNWADDNSVTGSIYGIMNNGDTTQLIEIWNFIDKSKNNLFYVNRTTGGWIGTGTITPYEGKHLNIQFKTRTDQGQEFYTRDLHYIEGPNKLKAVSQHKAKEEDNWGVEKISVWERITND
ncbi:MAG: hypothetical protein RLO81_19365 [Fulvivirga sp.]|uniref:hypothetical protein n=1 Tax=Fulvivirga sp. TaxID=1931237 RepID=UPI0032ECA69B